MKIAGDLHRKTIGRYQNKEERGVKSRNAPIRRTSQGSHPSSSSAASSPCWYKRATLSTTLAVVEKERTKKEGVGM